MGLKTNPEVICRRIGDGYYFLSARKEWGKCPYIQQISDTAAFYWDLLGKGYSKESIIERALSEYAIQKEVAAEDLDQFINQLFQNNYIQLD